MAALAVLLGAVAGETYAFLGGDDDEGMPEIVYVFCYADVDYLFDGEVYLTGVFSAVPPTRGLSDAFERDITAEFGEPDEWGCPVFLSADEAYADRADRIVEYEDDAYQVHTLNWTYNWTNR